MLCQGGRRGKTGKTALRTKIGVKIWARSPLTASPQGFPDLCLKAGAYAVFPDQQGTLDEHPVRCEQGELLVLAHFGELVLQTERAVQLAAGVEKAFERQAAQGVPAPQLFLGRVIFLNVADLGLDTVLRKPCLRFLAGGAFGIA